MKRAISCIILALAAFAVEPAVHSNAATAQESEAETKSVTLNITGMVTNNCPVLVKTAVGKMDGVSKVDASLEKKTATVEYDPGETSVDEIRQVIKDQVGFDSEVAD
jgi:copper chaperone CopZ